ncbi:MAG TPA: hypothetical protein VIK18_06400 [Pirellulales bacterium]
MIILDKYQKLKAIGKTPRDVYLAAKADGVSEVDALCLLRGLFGLTIVEAKESMVGGDAFAKAQPVEVGGTVYWEGADTIDGLWMMEARIKRIEAGFAYVGDHKKYLVHPEGLVETAATGALLRIPLKYFEKSLAEQLQESTDFWGQLALPSKSATAERAGTVKA